jgi:membrane protein YqaA with SNARE-associated domain
MRAGNVNLSKCQVERDLLALAWGFAEATFFFLVPDVLLSRIALKSRRACWRACLFALGGALAGGIIMYGWGVFSESTAFKFLDWVPSISRLMIERAAADLETHGLASLFRGAANGIPYKIYAVHAGAFGISFLLFILASAAARLMRFLIVCAIIDLIRRTLLKRLSLQACLRLHAIGWALFYLYYFSVMGN